ncbi:P-loop containing nucleoside triphosphate hydrolase protein [Lentinula edodes]|uniref:P-loop containing nucleoside triphosphate hydrolase protein n=1 Tax=Lentinula edodes TaxID=5353 RepID=UPI001E8D9D31|nr:P-loop containing nucleoside triphosphate hydrolase protein [Lentinula edodes]KAH7871023.1 P-loop containing nucleoside triphosphate hydrolase protein [Lentinula edodes]
MHRRISSFAKSSGKVPSSAHTDEKDTDSTASTIVHEAVAPPSLKIKRVDHYYSRWYKAWRYRNTSSTITVESVPLINRGENDPWKDYLFVIVRRLPDSNATGSKEPSFRFVVKSEYILKACKDVIQSWPGISWNSDPLEIDPEIFLTFLDEFIAYRDELASKYKKSDIDTYVLQSVDVLLKCLQTDYANTIATIQKLKAHGEITSKLLYSILVPRSIFVARCAITGNHRLFKLISYSHVMIDDKPRCIRLDLESIDLVDRHVSQTVGAGRVRTVVALNAFDGTVKIQDLDVYPLKFHPECESLRVSILSRAKKWVDLIGVHHKEFDGVAAIKHEKRLIRQTVKGRIMIDRVTFRRFNPNYQYPETFQDEAIINDTSDRAANADEFSNGTLVYARSGTDNESGEANRFTEEELLLTPTTVYGFSLSDKLWLEFDVERITDVDWNQDAFSNLVLPEDRKDLLQSLVEAHHLKVGFDDFIKGKGQGLVINLFGPPGVGKTFSAEATSEHVKQPLYLIGAGDLGTTAANLDLALERVFEVATAWKAIVLIDEADVFLEQRSLHDLERNAMVAVFLRHVEYYRGILFLTTNRVKAFDEAFLSRIHVALHFHELPFESKIQVWTAFIAKVGATAAVNPEQLRLLAMRNVNGRQIKNAARTAQSLAVGRGEPLSFKHFLSTLDAMDDFTAKFEAIRARNEE